MYGILWEEIPQKWREMLRIRITKIKKSVLVVLVVVERSRRVEVEVVSSLEVLATTSI